MLETELLISSHSEEGSLDALREETTTNLCSSLDERTKWVLFFAGLNSNYNEHPVLYYLHVFWNIVVIAGSLLGYIGYSMYIILTDVIYYSSSPGPAFFIVTLIFAWTVVLLQALALAYSTYYTYQRLNEKVLLMELHMYKSVISEIIVVIAVFIVISIPYLFLVGKLAAFFVFLFLFISFILGGCLLFIVVDAKFCLELINMAIRKCQNKKLSIHFVRAIRTEIDHRVTKYNSANSVLVFVAILNLCAMLLGSFSVEKFPPAILIPFAAFWLREVIVVSIAFWKVAQVNEASEVLIREISKSIEDISVVDSMESSQLQEQLQLLSSVSGNPITYPLVGMRLTRKEVSFRLVLWLIGVVIGLLQQK
jgi:hypothetical protein